MLNLYVRRRDDVRNLDQGILVPKHPSRLRTGQHDPTLQVTFLFFMVWKDITFTVAGQFYYVGNACRGKIGPCRDRAVRLYRVVPQLETHNPLNHFPKLLIAQISEPSCSLTIPCGRPWVIYIYFYSIFSVAKQGWSSTPGTPEPSAITKLLHKRNAKRRASRESKSQSVDPSPVVESLPPTPVDELMDRMSPSINGRSPACARSLTPGVQTKMANRKELPVKVARIITGPETPKRSKNLTRENVRDYESSDT